jgi:hypothetical protein
MRASTSLRLILAVRSSILRLVLLEAASIRSIFAWLLLLPLLLDTKYICRLLIHSTPISSLSCPSLLPLPCSGAARCDGGRDTRAVGTASTSAWVAFWCGGGADPAAWRGDGADPAVWRVVRVGPGHEHPARGSFGTNGLRSRVSQHGGSRRQARTRGEGKGA